MLVLYTGFSIRIISLHYYIQLSSCVKTYPQENEAHKKFYCLRFYVYFKTYSCDFSSS